MKLNWRHTPGWPVRLARMDAWDVLEALKGSVKAPPNWAERGHMGLTDLLKMNYTRLIHDRSGTQLQWTPEGWLLTVCLPTGAGVTETQSVDFYWRETDAIDAFVKAAEKK
jgi:hypothetical protein